VVNTLRRPPVRVAAGTVEAASAHVAAMGVFDLTVEQAAARDEQSASPSDPERAASSFDDRPATTASPTPSTTGRVSPFSTIRAAAPNMPNGRALRSVADRLLNVAYAMRKSGTAFNPSSAAQKPA
jgi:hypothetical protein